PRHGGGESEDFAAQEAQQGPQPRLGDLFLHPGSDRGARPDHAADPLLHNERALLLPRISLSAATVAAVPPAPSPRRACLQEVARLRPAETPEDDPQGEGNGGQVETAPLVRIGDW